MVVTENLPDPECRLGYTYTQLTTILGWRLDDFGRWMRGQTMSLCDGRKYNHDSKVYEEACGGVSHGGVVYRHDLERYLLDLPVID